VFQPKFPTKLLQVYKLPASADAPSLSDLSGGPSSPSLYPQINATGFSPCFSCTEPVCGVLSFQVAQPSFTLHRDLKAEWPVRPAKRAKNYRHLNRK